MLKYILITLSIVYLYFYKVSLNYKNPYKLIFVFGPKGSGKNTLMTKWSIKYNRKGYTVFSDSEIFNTYKLNTNWIGNYDFPKNSVLMIQEAGLTWNNRDFKTFPKEVTRFFKLQRHKNVIVILCSQSFDVDKKLRDLCDEMYLLKNIMGIFSIAKRINKKITIQKADDPDKNTSDQASFLTESYSFDFPIFWKFTYIPRYVRYFNSFECEELPLVQTVKYQYKDSSELYKTTRNNYYYKRKIIDYLDERARLIEEKRRSRVIPSNLLYKVTILRPDTLRY